VAEDSVDENIVSQSILSSLVILEGQPQKKKESIFFHSLLVEGRERKSQLLTLHSSAPAATEAQ
jgi:hypothetical protein